MIILDGAEVYMAQLGSNSEINPVLVENTHSDLILRILCMQGDLELGFYLQGLQGYNSEDPVGIGN